MKIPATFCFLGVMACLHGQAISVPEPPVDHLLDQTGKVTAEERAAVAAELDLAARNSGIGVYLVLLNGEIEEPPLDLARRLVDRWKGSADRAVLLSGPGMSPPLAVAVAGESLDSAPEAQVKKMTDVALAAGEKAAPGLPALLEAARSLVSQVAVFRAGGIPGETATVPPAEPVGYTQLAAWIAGGVLLCCILALLLRRRGRRSAMIFPPTEFRQRFSAPHSGGNDALVFFGKQ